MYRYLLHRCLAACVVLIAACDDTQHAGYPTASAARADLAIERGWLPAALPESATDISESHDLDTNTGGGSFRFGASDIESFRAQLQPMLPEQLERLHADRTKLQRVGYTFHSAPGFLLAVNWQTRHVHFWLDYKPQ